MNVSKKINKKIIVFVCVIKKEYYICTQETLKKIEIMTLIQTLTQETQGLKADFLAKTKIYCNEYYEVCLKRYHFNEQDWCKVLGITPEVKQRKNYNNGSVTESIQFPTNFFNTKESKTYRRLKDQAFSIKYLGLENFTAKELKNAVLHYEASIVKLASRIEAKGLDLTKLKVVTSSIGVNININLTDGLKTINAYTIVAQGEIQQPHYRYLIK